MADQFMTKLFKRGKRQYVIECLARDEHPYNGWHRDFPDLAAERLQEIKDGGGLVASIQKRQS